MELDNLYKITKELPAGEARLLLFHLLKKIHFLNEQEYSEEKFIREMKKSYRMLLDLTSEKPKREKVGPYKNIHILFGDSAAGGFKNIFKDDDGYKDQKIISFREMFSIGPICHLHEEIGIESRFTWMEKIIENEYGEFDEYKESFKSTVSQITSIPEGVPISIWAAENADEQTGLLFAIHLLKEKNNDVCVMNTTKAFNELFNQRKRKYTILHTGEIPTDKLQAIYEKLDREESPLTQHQREDYEKEWLSLTDDKETLRIWRYGRVQSVPEDYYDEFIIDRAKKLLGKRNQFMKAARIIGEVLGHLDQVVGDSFIELRLKKLIESGIFEAEGSLEAMRFYSVRLKRIKKQNNKSHL